MAFAEKRYRPIVARLFWLTFTFTAVIAHQVADAFCPQKCKCVVEGVSGIDAHCTELNADEQFFLKPVQHLTIANNGNDTHQMALIANVFTKVGLKSVESVKIVNSSLSEIDVNAFNGLSDLFDVNLSDNRLFLIHPDTFANNTNLHHLSLSGNPLQLTQVLLTPHEYLLRSQSLTEFDISFCQLYQILPLTFSQMRNLIFLNLSGNYLKVLPREVFRDLARLEELDVSYNSLTKLGKDAFKHNRELTVLKLKKNPIDYMNGMNIPQLQELDMSECKLTILMRESLEGMSSGLLSLNFSYNTIEILSGDAFDDLIRLKHLDLSYNNVIGPLPRGIFKRNNELETLSLSGNTNLTTLIQDDGFEGEHPALLRLDAASCNLTALNGSPFARMNSLTILNLSNNALRNLNANLFVNLTRLSQLDLSNNFIESLPHTLFDANDQLVKLIISGNPISELSALTFASLPNLKVLHANNCHLNRLWDNHKHVLKEYNVLSNLADLDLSGNNLKYLSTQDFSTFTRLEKIDLSANPLECVKTTIDVVEWLINRQVDPYYDRYNPTLNSDDDRLQQNRMKDKFRWNKLVGDICPVKSADDNTIPTAVNNNNNNNVVIVHQITKQQPTVYISGSTKVVEEQEDVEHIRTIVRTEDESIQTVMTDAEQHRVLQSSTRLRNKQQREEKFASDGSYLNEIVVEDGAVDSDLGIWQPMFVVVFILLAVYLVVCLVSYLVKRRATAAGIYIKPGTLGGHIRSTRAANGTPLYYKLYEECSIPTEQPQNKKTNILISFAPIHTLLKRGSYKIMKNNEVHL